MRQERRAAAPALSMGNHVRMDSAPDIKEQLLAAGISPTRQRLALADLLFRGPDRHLSAEQLFAEARGADCDVSFATIYNTLKTFCEAGLLREVFVDAERTYFDTNVAAHHHFYAEETRTLIDIADQDLVLTQLPGLPAGMAITGYDVMIRVSRK
jgi:Fur family transcriptional regulator, iron response regulator